MKSLLYSSIITAFLVVGCSRSIAPNHSSNLPLSYRNEQFGFSFFLPANWQGYSVLVQRWDGKRYLAAAGGAEVTDHGPIIVLRHPRWKTGDPYQDIPIRVFTRAQWEGAGQGPPAIDAGGVDYEIAHNARYVFAIWSRFNWDESKKGWQEANAVLKGNLAPAGQQLHPR